jgi:hypothetical protein
MRKAIIYKLGEEIGSVYVQAGELKIVGGEKIERLIASLRKTDKTPSLEAFVESLPDRLRSQVFAEVIDSPS